MSQAKVDEYKKYKQNKKKILKSEKRKKIAAQVIVRLIGILILAGVIFLVSLKGIDMYKSYQDSKPVFNTDSYVLGDLNGIDEEETTEEETTEVETTAEK